MNPWFLFCVFFTSMLAALVVVPILRHPSMPRGKRRLLASLVLIIFVPGSLVIYGWVGVPMLALL